MMQKALCDELKKLFDGKKYSGQQSKKALKIFEQCLPVDEGNDEDVDTDAAASPYIVAILAGGTINSPDKTQIASVMLTVCCYDDGLEREGYQDVMNIIEDIVQHFREYPQFGGAFEVMFEPDHEITWALQMDDTRPYYFGAALLDITTPSMTGDQNENWRNMI